MTDTLYRSIKIGSLELPGNLFLAPVAGYTDRVFRSICTRLGADFSFTELISAEALTRNPQKCSTALIDRGQHEKYYCIQLFGADPDVLGRACTFLAPFRPDAVDLNAGCPVPKVIKTGAGSALMKDPARLGRAVETMVCSSRAHLGDVPVTVKIRSGWDNALINYHECARIAVEAGAAMVSLHPRTRAQGYAGKSNWSFIAELAARLPVPVTGSGDLYTPEDARRMLAETKCAAIMFARGAMGNPFIFAAAKSFLGTGTWTPPGNSERLDIAMEHLEMLAKDLGEKRACLEMRKQFCAYTKGSMSLPGISGGGALREKIVRAATVKEYRELLTWNLPSPESPPGINAKTD
ncbi:MAG: tRNA dihydrouridine synthase DusB [Treponema sp.]|nr:tRNA dihydrouridine synthase DusB [Treponema sp.]